MYILHAKDALPMDEVLRLEMRHGRRDLGRHVEQNKWAKVGGWRTAAQIVEQVTMTHELGDDVKWRLSRTDTCKQKSSSGFRQ